jgi:hypothetical protein
MGWGGVRVHLGLGARGVLGAQSICERGGLVGRQLGGPVFGRAVDWVDIRISGRVSVAWHRSAGVCPLLGQRGVARDVRVERVCAPGLVAQGVALGFAVRVYPNAAYLGC